MAVVFAISDLHAPFHHPDVLEYLAFVKSYYKPDRIVCLGDELDQNALSVHTKELTLPTALEEFTAAMLFMKKLYKLFPVVDVCISNHGSRPFRVAQAAGLPSVYMKSYSEFMEAPVGWRWHPRVIIDGVVYEHGDPCSGKDGAYKAAFENRRSTVIGHIHAWGSVTYSANHDNQMFWANAGCLVNPSSDVFRYSSKYRNKCTLGSVVVVDGKAAHFIRMD